MRDLWDRMKMSWFLIGPKILIGIGAIVILYLSVVYSLFHRNSCSEWSYFVMHWPWFLGGIISLVGGLIWDERN